MMEIDKGVLTVVDGDEEILPGIRVIFSRGHTPGTQAVSVDKEKGSGQLLPLEGT
jgi:glyoxylase-like metal-dependent hydrolase (beta-lactamase superfamily II)